MVADSGNSITTTTGKNPMSPVSPMTAVAVSSSSPEPINNGSNANNELLGTDDVNITSSMVDQLSPFSNEIRRRIEVAVAKAKHWHKCGDDVVGTTTTSTTGNSSSSASSADTDKNAPDSNGDMVQSSQSPMTTENDPNSTSATIAAAARNGMYWSLSAPISFVDRNVPRNGMRKVGGERRLWCCGFMVPN